jgi:hypothetical protein
MKVKELINLLADKMPEDDVLVEVEMSSGNQCETSSADVIDVRGNQPVIISIEEVEWD